MNLSRVKRKHVLIVLGLIGFIGVFSWILFHFGPGAIVETIGVKNSYGVMFLMSVFGGVSTFTSVSYLATLSTLAIGGLNPLLLGFVAGTGLLISDSFFFYLGKEGRYIATGKPKEWAEKFETWLRKKPQWMVPVVTYVYTGLTPLPNDVLTIALAFAEVKYKRIVLPLWLGNMTLTALVGYLAVQGVRLL